MLKLAEIRGDVMGRFHNALYLGDVKEQVGTCIAWRSTRAKTCVLRVC